MVHFGIRRARAETLFDMAQTEEGGGRGKNKIQMPVGVYGRMTCRIWTRREGFFSVSFWEKVTAALFVAGRPTVSKWTLAGSLAGNRLFACRCKVGFFLDEEIEFWVALKIVKKVLTERNNYYF